MRLNALGTLLLCLVCGTPRAAQAQLAPGIGYMFPPGGQAGTTVDVVLGGYDWTPDMEVFVLQEGVTLEITGPPGPVIVPEPPYWFGKKARRSPDPLPRETPARLTIAKDAVPGVVSWQVANANGASSAGKFHIGAFPEVVEIRDRTEPQRIDRLPVTISGQIVKIEEVDEYTFRASKNGPITLSLLAGQLGSPLTAVLEVRNSAGDIVQDIADTQNQGAACTFAARAGEEYTVTLYDLDFRGDRSLVYRLQIAEAPQVLAAIPPAGVRGEKRTVEFVGYGVASGGDQLESVTREVAFPKSGDAFPYALETPSGTAAPISLGLLDASLLASSAPSKVQEIAGLPAAYYGVFEEAYGEHRYRIEGKKGDVWKISAFSARAGAPLDLSLAVFDEMGVEKRRVEDLAGSLDAVLDFSVPADGVYQIAVTDNSINSGDRSAVYRLIVEQGGPGFDLTIPESFSVALGEKATLLIRGTRTPGFVDPITLTFEGLPAGVTVPDPVVIPAKQTQVRVEFSGAADAAAGAALVTITGTAVSGEQEVRWQAPHRMLVAAVIKPPFSIDAEGKDDVTKWPRGTTFPGPVLIERAEGFDGEIRLEQASRQGRHRMGITGPEMIVPPGVNRVLYPVTLPEWLETTRTSRMVLNGVAVVKDPQGNVRCSLDRLKSRIGFLPTGALLKVSAQVTELEVAPGQSIEVPVSISRDRSLPQPLTLELVVPDALAKSLSAAPLTLSADATEAVFRIEPVEGAKLSGEHHLTIRGVVLQAPDYPVTSQTTVLVAFPETREVSAER